MHEGASTATRPPVWARNVRMTPSANRVGASAWIWRGGLEHSVLERVVARAAELGFDELELPLERIGAWDPSHARALLAEHGLSGVVCAVMKPDRDLSSFDPVTVRAGSKYLRACIDAAACLAGGSPSPERFGRASGLVAGPLHGPSALTPRAVGSTERRVVLERVTHSLRGLAAYAQERGVRLAVEPVNRYESNLINTAPQCVELVELVDSPACGLALDTFHMNIEERCPARAIRAAGPRLMHLHVSANDRGAPGSDHVYWSAIAEALREVRYRGSLVLESSVLGEVETRDALAFLRSLLVQTPAYA